MKSFAALSDPTRRRVLEILSDGDRSAGELSTLAQSEFGLSQPATSRHLRILREAQLVRCRTVGAKRIYTLDHHGIDATAAWLSDLRRHWETAFSALRDDIERDRNTYDTDISGGPS